MSSYSGAVGALSSRSWASCGCPGKKKVNLNLPLSPGPMESGRIGGAPLRDADLLEWCTTLLRDVLVPAKVPAPV